MVYEDRREIKPVIYSFFEVAGEVCKEMKRRYPEIEWGSKEKDKPFHEEKVYYDNVIYREKYFWTARDIYSLILKNAINNKQYDFISNVRKEIEEVAKEKINEISKEKEVYKYIVFEWVKDNKESCYISGIRDGKEFGKTIEIN
jgi:hypothetical protein